MTEGHEELFHVLNEVLRDHAFSIVDAAGCIVTWSNGARRLTGYSSEEVIGQPLRMMLPDAVPGADGLEHDVGEALKGNSIEVEGRRVRKDGTEFIANSVLSPLRDQSGRIRGVAILFRDVTEQRAIEEHLLQAQRFESLGKLAGGIAHDFNNMLMAIFVRTDLLLRLVGEAEPHRRYLTDIKAAAMKNRDLTQQFLATARRQVLQPKRTSLNEVVASTTRLLAPGLGEDISIRTELQPALWPVYADPGKLHQVVMNLTLNARDAMPRGGALTIETQNFHADPSHVDQEHNLAEGDYAVLLVTDSGQGIPLEIRQQIYEPFFSTKSNGTGLGLAVARGIVDQTGGQIRLSSEVGSGTTFKVFFPRYRGEQETVSEPERPQAFPVGGTETIMLVEDESLLRTVIRETLEEHGYHVLAAASPGEAVTLSTSSVERIDLLLVDLVMPGMNGRELAERIAMVRPSTPVIFMSGYTDYAAFDDGGPHIFFLEKPATTAALLRIVRSALDAPK